MKCESKIYKCAKRMKQGINDIIENKIGVRVLN